ncbi:hypothetical protein BSKO_02995 [Bryopsis sp. KO-2023]|nr:hypothetical protein BSKO_02995 [Bryopsis sp. KO-2023]
MAIEKTCDVLIRVKPEGASSSGGGSADSYTCTVAYGDIADSAYFSSAVARCKRGSRKEIQIIMSSAKLETCKMMLKFVRSKKIPSLTVEKLLELLEMADRFKLRSCALAASVRLGRVPISPQEAYSVFKLQKSRPTVSLYPGTRLAVEAATRSLLDIFRDLERVAQKESLLDAFVKLPAIALVELLAQDDLMVVKENTVFYLVTLWFMNNYPDSTPADQEYFHDAMQIGAQIRFPMMSENYLKRWAPTAKWIADFLPSARVWIDEALEYRLVEAEDLVDTATYTSQRFRERAKPTTSNELSWKVPAGVAKEKMMSGYVTQGKFCGGYHWRIGLESKKKSNDSGLGMHLYAEPPLLEMDDAFHPDGKTALKVEGKFKLSSRKFVGDKKPKTLELANPKWDLGTGWGFSDFYDEDAEYVFRRGSPYVDNTGHLGVAAIIDELE